MSQPPGIFITVEGIEGSGKSTQVNQLAEYMRGLGHTAITTREPGGTEIGEAIRGIFLHHGGSEASTELLLVFAARNEHLHKLILPALARGDVVICDRFTDASYAYQGAGRGMTKDRINALEEWVQQGFTPHLTLLLDLPVDVALNRTHQRRDNNRFEAERLQFHEAVRRGYLELAARYPVRIRIVDAMRPVEQVTEQLIDFVKQYLQGCSRLTVVESDGF